MAPCWLLRLNQFLAWLNPTLGLVAMVLALLVAGAADQRLAGNAVGPPVAAARSDNVPRLVACTPATCRPSCGICVSTTEASGN